MEREPRAEKVAVVDEVRERFDGAGAVVLTEYRGIDVTAMQTLRRSLREAGGEYKIYKNTLVRLAIAERNIDGLTDLISGPTAIAFVDNDAAAVAKALRDFAKDNDHLIIKGALLGDQLIDEAGVLALADLPSRDQLLGQLAGAFQAPMSKFAALLQAPITKFAYGLQALIAEGGDADASEAVDIAEEEASEAVDIAEEEASEAVDTATASAEEDSAVESDTTQD